MPLKDEWRDEVLRLHESGLSRDGITAEVPISSAYVSQIVAEAGRTFPGTGQSARATQGRIAKRADQRLAQAEQLMTLADQAMTRGRWTAAAAACAAVSQLAGADAAQMLRAQARDELRVDRQPPG